MKRTILAALTLLFALSFVLISWKPEATELNASESPTPTISDDQPSSGASAAVDLLTMALHAAMVDPNATCEDIRNLYFESLAARCEIAKTTSTTTTTAKMSMSSDLCPCPNDPNRLCPCPPDTTSSYSAHKKYQAQVAIDNKQLSPKAMTGKNMKEWQRFGWPGKLSDSTHTLTISGNFYGNVRRTYTMKFEVKNGRGSLPWRK